MGQTANICPLVKWPSTLYLVKFTTVCLHKCRHYDLIDDQIALLVVPVLWLDDNENKLNISGVFLLSIAPR